MSFSESDQVGGQQRGNTAFARCFGDEAREGRLRWSGRVQRRNRDCKGRILREELAGRRITARP